MGREKALVPFGGRPLAAWVIEAMQRAGLEVVVVAKRPLDLGVPVWIEPEAPTHPLLGIVTALERHGAPVVAAACDLPFLTESDVRALAAAAGPVACAPGHPLAARWEPAVLGALRAAVADGAAVRAVVERLGATPVALPERSLRNLNRPEDVAALQPPTSPPPSSTAGPPP